MSAFRRKNIENIETAPKQASTAFNVGEFVQWNGTGEVEPLEPTSPVAGLCLEKISSTDEDYASERQIHLDLSIESNDRFIMSVGTGTATANMIGSTFDVDGSDAGALDVSGAGTQFTITQFFSATSVEVKVAKYEVDAE